MELNVGRFVVVVFLEGRSWYQAQQLQVALLGLSAAEILEVRGAQRLGIGARLMWGEAAAEQGAHGTHRAVVGRPFSSRHPRSAL